MRAGKLAADDQDAAAIARSSGSVTPKVVATLSSETGVVPAAGVPVISAPVVFGVPAPERVMRPPLGPPTMRVLFPIETVEPVFAQSAATAGGTIRKRRTSAATTMPAMR